MDLLSKLSELNAERCKAFGHEVHEWSPTDWACALAGETGELCNLVKKMRRGDLISTLDVAHEAADIVIYLDLLCTRVGVNLRNAIIEKFNIVSDRANSPIKIGAQQEDVEDIFTEAINWEIRNPSIRQDRGYNKQWKLVMLAAALFEEWNRIEQEKPRSSKTKETFCGPIPRFKPGAPNPSSLPGDYEDL